MEKRSTLCVTGGRAHPDVMVRVGSMMLMKGGRTGKLEQPSLEVEPRCRKRALANRTVAWPIENSDSVWHAMSLARRTRCMT